MDPLSSPFETLVLSYRDIFSIATLSHLWTWVAILSAAISLWRFKASAANLSVRKTQSPPPEIVSGRNERNGHRRSPSSCTQTQPSPRTHRTNNEQIPEREGGSYSAAFEWMTPTVNNEQIPEWSPSSCTQTQPSPQTYCATQSSTAAPDGSFKNWGEEKEEDANRRIETIQADVDRERRDSHSANTKRIGCVLCERGRGRFAVYFHGERRPGDDNENEPAEKTGFSFGGECRTTVNYWRLAPTLVKGPMPLAAECPWYGGIDLTVLNGNVVRLWDSVDARK